MSKPYKGLPPPTSPIVKHYQGVGLVLTNMPPHYDGADEGVPSGF